MTPYTNTSKSHQQAWNSNPTSSATPIPSPLMKHMMKMQKKTMIENCSFALLINDILLKMNLNNRKNMSTMNCTSDINTDYCMNPIKMKKRNMPIQRWRCCFSGPFPWDHQDEGMISFNVRCCSPGAIHLQRPVGSLPKTRWFDCRTRRWLGCLDGKTAGEIGSEEPHGFSSYFLLLTKKSGIRWGRSQLCKKSFVFGVHFGLEYNCTVFVSKPCVYLSPRIWVMDACWFSSACRFGTVRHRTTKNRWFQKLVLPSLKHTRTMSMIPSLKKAIGKVDTIQWCISDDPMVLPSLKQFSFADLEGVPAYSQGGVWLKLTNGGSSSKRKVPRKNEAKLDTINQHEDVSVTSQ